VSNSEQLERQTIPFDSQWRFHRGDIAYDGEWVGWNKSGVCVQSGSRKRLDDSQWRVVDLPHDYAVESPIAPRTDAKTPYEETPEIWDMGDMSHLHGSLATGVAWYRKSFNIPENDSDKRIYVQFDGAFRNSRTFLNDHYIGDHASGYTGFCYDLTDCIEYGGANTIAVRVDASEPEGWFYEGAGLYRHVRLIKVDPLHIAPWGVYVRPDFDPANVNRATVFFSVNVRNRRERAASATLRVRITDRNNTLAADTHCMFATEAWDDTEVIGSLVLDHPHLWTLDDPYLYTCTTEVVSDGQICDRLETTLGVRSAKFDASRGFILNGASVKLKGMCVHQDHAGVGSAVPDSVQEYRIRRLKDMGCNAYRTAHNPPSPELLDICDRLGMLVMVENRLLSSGPEYLDQLESMLRIHRNHACVVIWSIGNEEFQVQTRSDGVRIARTLCHVAHKLDPGRPITLALCTWDQIAKRDFDLARLLPISEQVDVMGLNYSHQNWLEYHRLCPNKPFVVTEDTSSGPTRGCYVRDDEACRLSFINPLADAAFRPEENWRLVAQNDFIAGLFIWTGFDYRGEPTPYDWPAVASNFGVMDSCGFSKDIFYYYQSQWTSTPMVYLFPHWTHPGNEGKPITLYAHTNGEEAELIVNGTSRGTQRTPPFGHLSWPDVPYEPGCIEAVAYAGGREVARHRIETTGKPHAVRLLPDRMSAVADVQDAVVINVAVVDNEGRVVPDAENRLEFRVDGPIQLIGTGNGNPSSHEADKSSSRRVYAGWCQVIVRIDSQAGLATLTAASDGLLDASCEIRIDRK